MRKRYARRMTCLGHEYLIEPLLTREWTVQHNGNLKVGYAYASVDDVIAMIKKHHADRVWWTIEAIKEQS